MVTISTFLSGILGIVIMYFLILSFQATGAAIGTMIGYFVACIMTMIFAKRLIRVGSSNKNYQTLQLILKFMGFTILGLLSCAIILSI